jgi:hypothetical protein
MANLRPRTPKLAKYRSKVSAIRASGIGIGIGIGMSVLR